MEGVSYRERNAKREVLQYSKNNLIFN
jgi:hypothetical protein